MNMIDLVSKYLPMLDEQYKREARSSILDVAPEFVQMTREAKKIRIAKMRVDGLADYSRHSGFTAGYTDLTWQEHEFTQDRGRALQIDVMDNVETFGLAFGRLAGEFQRIHVVPEIDAYRFSTYYKRAMTKWDIALSGGKILQVIDQIDAQMDDDEVPFENRLLFVNPTVYKFMMNDPTIVKNITFDSDTFKSLNKTIARYNNHPIIMVPSKRFYTAITQRNGTTTGQEAGGYGPAAGARVIGMLMVHPSAVLQLAKRDISRVWAPTRAEAAGTDGVNPNADAWRFDYRIYHDAWVLEEKLTGIAGVLISEETARIETIDIVTDDPDVEIEAGTTTINPIEVDTFLARADVTSIGGASTAVTWSTSDSTVAAVTAAGIVQIRGAGTATITATSVFSPDVSGTLVITVSA